MITPHDQNGFIQELRNNPGAESNLSQKEDSFEQVRHVEEEYEEYEDNWHVVSKKRNNYKTYRKQKKQNHQQSLFDEVFNASEVNISNNILILPNSSSIKNKTKKREKEKLPDRKLYSAREKHSKKNEKKEIVKEAVTTNVFEDDKSDISTGSTAFSERPKHIDEEINLFGEEKKERNAFHEIDSPHPEIADFPLLSICLERQGNFEIISIYEEEDYESLLDNICFSHNMVERVALPFKINLMRAIQEMHSDPVKVESYLNQLLEKNYQMIIGELENEIENTNPQNFSGPEDYFFQLHENSN